MTGVPANGVPSPCTGLCSMDAGRRWCDGCFRTLDEIAGWAGMSDEEKRRVREQLPARRATCPGSASGGSKGLHSAGDDLSRA